MREMKDSRVEWIGEIPADWEYVVVKRCYYLKGRIGWQGLKAAEFISDGPYLVTGTDFQCGTIDWGRCYHISEDRFLEAPEIHLQEGDLLVTKDGTVGKVAYVEDLPGRASLNSHLLLVRPLSGKYSSRFLFWIIQSSIFDRYFQLSQSGTIMASLSQEKIGSFSYFTPSIEEQQHLAAYLDRKCAKIDAIIARQQQVIEKLKAYKLSVITEAVTKGLNPDVPMKDSGIEWVDEIPAHWENRKMLSILAMRVVDGPHESPVLFDTGIPYISATAIVDGKIDFHQMRGYISEEYCNVCDRRYAPQLDDILIVKLGASTGQVALVETTERFNIWVPLAAVRCGQDAIPKFIYYAFQSDYFIRQMEQSWTYGTQETLGVKTIERLRVLLPKLDEQIAIAFHLDQKCFAIRRLIKQKEVLVEKLTEYKKSLIYEVVTGKKEV